MTEYDRNHVEADTHGGEEQLATGQSGLRTRASTWYIVLALIFVVLLVHWETVDSMVAIWIRSDTFAHGFLVVPISLYLLWRRREKLRSTETRPNLWGVLAFAVLVFVWFVSDAVDVAVIKQLTVVAMIPAVVWALAGTRVLHLSAFPLAFLVFSVPMGEGLLAHLMDFTVSFIVTALQIIDVPVYRDGLYFSTANGDFEVAKACSGLRYLIASIALGAVYAYISYRSSLRRALFMALAIIVPIVANGIRAVGIVLLAHWSNLQLAAGVDHLIYGWLFFGLVILGLFWLGTLFSEPQASHVEQTTVSIEPTGTTSRNGTVAAAVAIATFLVVAPLALWILQSSVADDSPQPRLVQASPGWTGPFRVDDSTWRPVYQGADRTLQAQYKSDKGSVDLFVAFYARQQQGAELVNSENRVYNGVTWRRTAEREAEIATGPDSDIGVTVTSIRSSNQRRLVYHWYEVGGRSTRSAIGAKLLQAWSILSSNQRGSALVAVAADYSERPEEVQSVMGNYVAAHLDSLRSCIMSHSPHDIECAETK